MDAPDLKLQQVSVTRKMAASLPRLREIAQGKGLKMHHLGAGYPHPEVTDPRKFLEHQSRYFEFLEKKEGINEAQNLPEYLRESYPTPIRLDQDLQETVLRGSMEETGA